MRFQRLSFLAYGPFTDLTLDLGDGAGLHVLHGANEAGKSSARRALLAFLFGIPHATTDSFLHENTRLRIGAALSRQDGLAVELVRRKGRKDTLLSPSEKPVPADSLAPFLGVLDEGLYSRHFAIDHESLRAGGDDLLAGGGDVGTSLYSAALGGNVNQLLAALEEEAEAIFAPRGHNPSLNQALAAHEVARKATKEHRLAADTWLEQQRDLEATVGERAEVTKQIACLGAELHRAKRLRDVIPKLAERQRLAAQLAALGETVRLGATFTAEYQKATSDRATAAKLGERATNDLRGHEDELKGIPDQRALLERQADIEALHEQLGGHRKAAQDLPRRKGQRDEAVKEARELLADLWPDATLDDARARMPPLPRKRRIQTLVADAQTHEGAITAAEARAADLAATATGVATELAGLPAPCDPSGLRHAVNAARAEGRLEADLSSARAELELLRGQATVELARLSVGDLTLDQVEVLPVPSAETCQHFDGALGALDRARERLATETEALAKRLLDLTRQLEELRLAGDVPTETQLAEARVLRDHDWGVVRGAWLEGQAVPTTPVALAEGYEARVQGTDDLADRLRREADRVARLATLASAHGAALADKDRLHTAALGNQTDRDRVASEWLAAWAPTGVSPLSPREMLGWLGRHAKVTEKAAALRKQAAKVGELESRLTSHRTALAEALAQLGAGGGTDGQGTASGFAALLGHASERLAGIEAAERRRAALEEQLSTMGQDRDRASSMLAAARLKRDEWRVAWDDAVEGLALAKGSGPGEVGAVIEQLTAIVAKLDEAAGFEQRMRAIERDAAEFASAVAALVAEVAPDLAIEAPDLAARKLQDRLTEARAQASRRQQLAKQIVAGRKAQGEAARQLKESEADLDRLAREVGTDDPARIPEVIRVAEAAADLRGKLEQVEQQIVELGQASVDKMEAEAAAVDPHALPTQIADLERELEERQAKDRELSETIGRKRGELEKVDGTSLAAQAAEDAQAALARIRELGESYVRLRLAHSLLRRQVASYREQHQEPLLARASDLFQRLTLRSFAGVAVDFDDDDRPVLVGVRSGNAATPTARGSLVPAGAERVRVEGMSDGTRDQLHLALRLATIERHLEKGEPLPLIVDDALVHFDDDRSLAALQIFAELSKRTQVLFFTHHARLVELARRAAGEGVTVHNLAGRAGAA